MLRWRLLLGTLLIGSLVGLCWLDFHAAVPGTWLLPLAIVASLLATHEVLDLAACANLRPQRWTIYCGNVVLVAGSWLGGLIVATQCGWQRGLPLNPRDVESWVYLTVFGALGAAVFLVLLGEMVRYEQPGGHTGNLAAGILAIIYVGLMLGFAVQLRVVHGVGALAAWVIVVKTGDTGAYTVGRLIGRHKLAPRISPGKTIEGAVGGLVFACLGSWLAIECLVPLMSPTVPSPSWLVFGLLVGGAGMLGDLAESFLKRDVGRKDSSTWLPGFGGVLDILDSLLLSAPAAWACWQSGLL